MKETGVESRESGVGTPEAKGRKAAEYQKLQAEIRGYLIGATILKVSVCDRLAAGIAAIAEKHAERTEFAEIVARLVQRGVITREDADRIGDGSRKVAKGAEVADA